MNRLRTMVLLVSVFVMVSLAAGPQGCAASDNSAARRPAADFQLTDLNGTPLSLSSLKGKVVLIDFWATWCPPCRMEIPHLKELYASYKGKGLEIVGLSIEEDAGAVKGFVQSNGIPYPVALADAKLQQAYGGIRGIPTAFLVDKKGRIAKQLFGYTDKEVFDREIQKLLSEG